MMLSLFAAGLRRTVGHRPGIAIAQVTGFGVLWLAKFLVLDKVMWMIVHEIQPEVAIDEAEAGLVGALSLDGTDGEPATPTGQHHRPRRARRPRPRPGAPPRLAAGGRLTPSADLVARGGGRVSDWGWGQPWVVPWPAGPRGRHAAATTSATGASTLAPPARPSIARRSPPASPTRAQPRPAAVWRRWDLGDRRGVDRQDEPAGGLAEHPAVVRAGRPHHRTDAAGGRHLGQRDAEHTAVGASSFTPSTSAGGDEVAQTSAVAARSRRRR